MQAPLTLAIDIGSSKICALIAEVNLGVPRIIGMAKRNSLGIRKGVVSNIEQASHSIKSTVDEAKRMAGVENLPKASICISGAYASGENFSGITNVPDGEIKLKDIERVMKDSTFRCKSLAEAIHILPYRFQVDDYNQTDDPMGLAASRLECYTHVVTAKQEGLENLKKVVRNCGIEIKDIILSAYASSIAVLSAEEKREGVACIDIGGEICDVMVHSGLSMCYNDYLGVGSNHITSDLAKILAVSIPVAEQIKKDYGDLVLSKESKGKALGFPTKDSQTKQVDMEVICDIIQMRVRETLEILNSMLEKSEIRDYLRGGVVLTGGFAKLKNLQKYTNELKIFQNLPVRIGTPVDIEGIGSSDIQSPEMATAVGLVLYSAGRFTNYEYSAKGKMRLVKSYATKEVESIVPDESTEVGDVQNLQIQPLRAKGAGNPLKRVFSGFYEWLKGLF